LELEVEHFMEAHGISPETTPTFVQLAGILENVFNIKIATDTFSQYPELAPLRSIHIPGAAPVLLLNPNLTEQQRAFAVARELGFEVLQLKPRLHTSTWVKVGSFEEVLNNFKASYFAGALLLNRDRLVQDMQTFFAQPTW